MRHIVSSYVDACDTRVEIIEDGEVIASRDYSTADWVRANRHFGQHAMNGKHVRLVSTGLVEHVISEVFGLLSDDHHAGPCPACGAACISPHDRSDPTGRRIIASHWEGDHKQCHPDGCHEEPARQQVRTRRRK